MTENAIADSFFSKSQLLCELKRVHVTYCREATCEHFDYCSRLNAEQNRRLDEANHAKLIYFIENFEIHVETEIYCKKYKDYASYCPPSMKCEYYSECFKSAAFQKILDQNKLIDLLKRKITTIRRDYQILLDSYNQLNKRHRQIGQECNELSEKHRILGFNNKDLERNYENLKLEKQKLIQELEKLKAKISGSSAWTHDITSSLEKPTFFNKLTGAFVKLPPYNDFIKNYNPKKTNANGDLIYTDSVGNMVAIPDSLSVVIRGLLVPLTSKNACSTRVSSQTSQLKPNNDNNLGKTEQKILDILEENDTPMSAREIAEAVDIHPKTIYKYLSTLVEQDFIFEQKEEGQKERLYSLVREK